MRPNQQIASKNRSNAVAGAGLGPAYALQHAALS
jgi:hypothetical protein